MNKTELKYYGQIKRKMQTSGIYDDADEFVIKQAAQMLWQIEKARRLMDKAGQIQKFKTGARQISPEINNWRGLNQDFIKYANLLGLTPIARQKLKAQTEQKEEVKDPLQGLRKVV